MTARPFARALAALVAAFVAAACGEDVNFNAAPAGDAAVKEAAASLDGATNDGSTDASQAGDASPCSSDAATGMCRSNGQMCERASDCCSMRCESAPGDYTDYCLPSGTCSAPGAECENRGTCCSGRCEPGGPHGSLECGPFCQPNGSPCESPQDCCSLGCNAGVCGGPICGALESVCSDDSGCCSGRCSSGHCAPTAEQCFTTGEECGADTGMYCCSQLCNTATGRCDLGPGACREPSSPCIQTDPMDECCLGSCQPNAQEGVPVCTAQCRGQGADCGSDGDCCTGFVCGGTPSTCRACP